MKALSSLATLSLALFLTSCSFTQQVADAPSDAAKAEPQADAATPKEKADAPAPTAEQQKAAEELLKETAPSAHTEGSSLPPQDSPAGPDTTLPATSANGIPLPSGGLRMGSIIPQEDPASVGEAPAPTANSVELRGLRSPKMPSKLPMGIDGKLKSN